MLKTEKQLLPSTPPLKQQKQKKKKQRETENDNLLMSAAEVDLCSPSTISNNKTNNIPHYDGTMEFKPYEFQVAGHVAMLRTKSGRLFKPLKQQELWFYSIVGNSFPSLIPFMPEFLGCVDINISQLRRLEGTLCNYHTPVEDSLPIKDWHPWSVQMHRARLLEISEFQAPSYCKSPAHPLFTLPYLLIFP
jgi:hypothetical protein